jgi:hypothetical protein
VVEDDWKQRRFFFIPKLSKSFANRIVLSLMADSVLECLLTKVDGQKRTVTSAYSNLDISSLILWITDVSVSRWSRGSVLKKK